jgi:hypothetical protein
MYSKTSSYSCCSVLCVERVIAIVTIYISGLHSPPPPKLSPAEVGVQERQDFILCNRCLSSSFRIVYTCAHACSNKANFEIDRNFGAARQLFRQINKHSVHHSEPLQRSLNVIIISHCLYWNAWIVWDYLGMSSLLRIWPFSVRRIPVSVASLARAHVTADQLLDLIIQTVLINRSIAANISSQWAVYYFSSVGLPCSNLQSSNSDTFSRFWKMWYVIDWQWIELVAQPEWRCWHILP